MQFVRLMVSIDGRYSYYDSSSEEMNNLDDFLVSDVRCNDGFLSYREWALNSFEDRACGNITYLEKQDGYILLSDIFSDKKFPIVLKMKLDQFIYILNQWEEKVCKLRPKEVIIKYENNQFVMETKD